MSLFVPASCDSCLQQENYRYITHEAYFLGSAQFDLEALSLSRPFDRLDTEEYEPKLRDHWRDHGLTHGIARDKVLAKIDQAVLSRALSASGCKPEDLRRPNRATLPRVSLPPGVTLECFHGQHIIHLLRKCALSREEQWWMVDVYSSRMFRVLPEDAHSV